MNPWALLVILLGILLVIIGVKGSQHQVVSTITGKSSTSNSGSNSSGSSSGQSGSGSKSKIPVLQGPVLT